MVLGKMLWLREYGYACLRRNVFSVHLYCALLKLTHICSSNRNPHWADPQSLHANITLTLMLLIIFSLGPPFARVI